MIDKLFYTFAFLLCILIPLSWLFGVRIKSLDKNILIAMGISMVSAIIAFLGFVVTGILRIWI